MKDSEVLIIAGIIAITKQTTAFIASKAKISKGDSTPSSMSFMSYYEKNKSN